MSSLALRSVAAQTSVSARSERITFLNDQLITRVYAAVSALGSASREVTPEAVAERARLPLARVHRILAEHPGALDNVVAPQRKAPASSIVESLIECMDAHRKSSALASRILATLPRELELSRPAPQQEVFKAEEARKGRFLWPTLTFIGVGVVGSAVCALLGATGGLTAVLAGGSASIAAGVQRMVAMTLGVERARARYHDAMYVWRAEQIDLRAPRANSITLEAFHEIAALRASFGDAATPIVDAMRAKLAKQIVNERPGEMTPVAEGRLRQWAGQSVSPRGCASIAGEVLDIAEGRERTVGTLQAWLRTLSHHERQALTSYLRDFFFDGEISRFDIPRATQVQLTLLLSTPDT